MIRILVIPDLHLFDKDLIGTRGYAEQSLSILRGIRKVVTENSYELVIMGGDLQHGQLSDMKYISKFYKEIHEISKLVSKYTNQPHILSTINTQHPTSFDTFGVKTSKLFSIRGQHDFYKSEYTFYDMLEENNVINCPSVITINDLQVNLFNFSTDIMKLKTKKLPGMRKVIGIYHNPVIFGGKFTEGHIDDIDRAGEISDENGTSKFNTEKGKVFTPNQHQIYNNVDFAVMNDVHRILVDQEIKTFDFITKVVVPGSLGRTTNDDHHNRDYGNLVEISVDEMSYDITHKLIEIPLVPAKEFLLDKSSSTLTEVYHEMAEEINEGTQKWNKKTIGNLLDINDKAVVNALNQICGRHNDSSDSFRLREKDEKFLLSLYKTSSSGKQLTEKQIDACRKSVKWNYIDIIVDIANKRI